MLVNTVPLPKLPRLISWKAFRAFYDGGHYSRGDSIHSDTGSAGPVLAGLPIVRAHSVHALAANAKAVQLGIPPVPAWRSSMCAHIKNGISFPTFSIYVCYLGSHI